jgi:glucose-1-phosphate thymidylyltransferase
MKGLVLSGGVGSRLRPFTHSMPKQLMPIANKPVLEHVLENLREIGVTEVGLVVGDSADQIESAIGDGARLGLRITYLHQERPLGLAHCVHLAQDFLGEDDFYLYLGDCMLPEGVVEFAESVARAGADAHVLVHKVADPREFGVAELDENGAVRALVEKPSDPRSDLALTGVYFFTPAVHAAIASIEPSARGELEITDAIQWMVAAGARVRADEHAGYWSDVGRVEDVLDCNRHVVRGLRPRNQGQVDAASTVAGRVVIEPGARVVNSHITGPAIIGADSLIEGSRLGANTSIGRGCVLQGAQLGDSVVLDGASIRGVNGLRDSLIGRSSAIESSGGRSCHRLLVGDHTRIALAA